MVMASPRCHSGPRAAGRGRRRRASPPTTRSPRTALSASWVATAPVGALGGPAGTIAGGTTMTSHGITSSTPRQTEPAMSPASRPSPRVPTTSRSSGRARVTSAWTAGSWVTTSRLVTPDGGPFILAAARADCQASCSTSSSTVCRLRTACTATSSARRTAASATATARIGAARPRSSRPTTTAGCRSSGSLTRAARSCGMRNGQREDAGELGARRAERERELATAPVTAEDEQPCAAGQPGQLRRVVSGHRDHLRRRPTGRCGGRATGHAWRQRARSASPRPRACATQDSRSGCEPRRSATASRTSDTPRRAASCVAATTAVSLCQEPSQPTTTGPSACAFTSTGVPISPAGTRCRRHVPPSPSRPTTPQGRRSPAEAESPRRRVCQRSPVAEGGGTPVHPVGAATTAYDGDDRGTLGVEEPLGDLDQRQVAHRHQPHDEQERRRRDGEAEHREPHPSARRSAASAALRPVGEVPRRVSTSGAGKVAATVAGSAAPGSSAGRRRAARGPRPRCGSSTYARSGRARHALRGRRHARPAGPRSPRRRGRSTGPARAVSWHR